MKVAIKNILNSSVAAFHSEGLLIYEQLEQAYLKKEKIVLSFEGIDHCATQFLNACIGKLYLLHEPNLVDSLISYEFGSQDLSSKISEVRQNAINSKEYDSLLSHAYA